MTFKRSIVLAMSILLVSMVFLFIKGVSYTPSISTATQPHNGESLLNEHPAQIEKTILHIEVSLSPDSYRVLQALNKEFVAENPDIQVILTNMTDEELYDHYRENTQLQDMADIMLMDNSWVKEFAVLGYLQPADNYYSGDLAASILPSVMQQVKWNGYMWGVPFSIDPYVLVYHLQSQQLSAEDIHYNLSNEYAFISLAGSYDANWRLNILGLAEPHSNDNDNAEPVNDDQELSLSAESRIQYNTLSEIDDWAMLQEGKLGALVTGLSAYRQHLDPAIAAALLTSTDNGDPVVLITGNSFVVSSASENSSEAYKWISEITNKQTGLKFLNSGDIFPAVITAFEDPNNLQDELKILFADVFRYGYTLPPDHRMAEKLSFISDRITNSPMNQTEVREFMSVLMESWHELKF